MKISLVQKKGVLIRRYKRFLADVCLPDGEVLTAHCPNTGSMTGCSAPGSQVVVTDSQNLKRKYPWTLEMVFQDDVWIGVNTFLTNKLVREALENGIIDDFGTVEDIRPEVKTSDNSRLDFLLQTSNGATYLEVKNCSLVMDQVAYFPDAVTARGTKHLKELLCLKEQGHESAVLFVVQRGDGKIFRPAAHVDENYAQTLREVAGGGVKVLAYQADVSPERIVISHKIPCEF
ncbi:MAG: DNA/RNA nuclease SfsA [Desulfobulbaceae bacterium]|nr:DNA/RNA nuclease SfsA [Desulfobulbaceae bacterium]